MYRTYTKKYILISDRNARARRTKLPSNSKSLIAGDLLMTLNIKHVMGDGIHVSEGQKS